MNFLFGLTPQETIQKTLTQSSEIQKQRFEIQSNELVEPLFLSDLDTQVDSLYTSTTDKSPRSAPVFEGNRSKTDVFNVGFSQKTLLGTQTRLAWENTRLKNPSFFREIDPTVDSILKLEIRQSLLKYAWGRPDVSRRKRYRSDVLVAQERFQFSKESLAIEALKAHLDLYEAKEQVRIAQSALESSERLLRKNLEKKRYGIVEESDVFQAEASLESDKTELLLSKLSFQLAENKLSELIKETLPQKNEIIISPLPLMIISSLDEALRMAVLNRADLKAQNAVVESSQWAFRSEKLETLPDLFFTGSYGSAGLDNNYNGAWDQVIDFKNPVTMAGLGVSFSIGNKKEKLLRRNKELAHQIALQDQKTLQERINREVNDAWQVWKISKEKLEARDKLFQLQKKKLLAEEKNFSRGRSNTDLLVRFQQDIYRSELELLSAETNEIFSRANLARSVGILIQWLEVKIP
ncbi:MAG: TolC family protein [Elusimicrobiota bacterium]